MAEHFEGPDRYRTIGAATKYETSPEERARLERRNAALMLLQGEDPKDVASRFPRIEMGFFIKVRS